MRNRSCNNGFTIVELTISTALVSVVGLVIFSLLNIGTILGAKNTAVNTAHQQARTAMQQIIQDLHMAVSLPYLVDVDDKRLDPIPDPSDLTKTIPNPGPAAGIAFQQYAIGPLRIAEDAKYDEDKIFILVPAAKPKPVKGQRLIVPTHEIELEIKKVANQGSGKYEIEFYQDMGVDIKGIGGSTNYNIVCFITDRISFRVVDGGLVYTGPSVRKSFSVMGNGITNPKPFSTPTTAAGAFDYKFIAAIDLSTSDSKYNNRGFKSANILLNGKVPTRARLTTTQ